MTKAIELSNLLLESDDNLVKKILKELESLEKFP